ncbi:hypothetical protein [Actinocorallia populi]|uniref:hypothetical protein n=1 Tax=Actinocorallia populi TaxID=2079200 RepID=UPI0013002719|nr:hypothetical protein [Actinocorallia populi]
MSSQARSRNKPKGAGEDGFWPENEAEPPKGRILVGALLALLLIVGGAVWYVVQKDDGEVEVPPGSHLPDVYVPQTPSQESAALGQRSADIRAFTEGEVFGEAKEVSYREYAFTLVKSEVSANCVRGAWGDLLLQTLRRGECSQMARGAYLSKDKKYAGVFAAINMVDAKSAQQVLNSLDPSLQGGFVRPLPIPGVQDFGSGFTAAYSQAIGHYVIMSWVGLADGAQPQAMNELIDSSLAVQKPEDFAWGRLVQLDPQ